MHAQQTVDPWYLMSVKDVSSVAADNLEELTQAVQGCVPGIGKVMVCGQWYNEEDGAVPGQARKKSVLDGGVDYIFLQQVIQAGVQLSATRQQQDDAPVYCLDGDATKSLRTQCKMVQRCFIAPV